MHYRGVCARRFQIRISGILNGRKRFTALDICAGACDTKPYG
jgi:hypothetical protein